MATDVVAGVTESFVKIATVTVKAADPVMLPEVAVIVAVPCVTPWANPLLLFTVATAVADELHFALVVKFCVLPLL
jgi:hypothetical protein